MSSAFTEAARTGDPELVVAACALDPLSAAVATLAETREMVAETFAESLVLGTSIEGRPIVAERFGATIHVLHVVTLHDVDKDDSDADFPDISPFVERAVTV